MTSARESSGVDVMRRSQDKDSPERPNHLQEDVHVAKLPPEAKRVVKGTPLESKRELLALARLPKEKLAMTARVVASGEGATVAEAMQKPHGEGKVSVQSSHARGGGLTAPTRRRCRRRAHGDEGPRAVLVV
ncbi:hypothetical protein WME98_18490 [Sorangium sp. So ce296]|uniref:hypothetical protein n=1 Tax=Sorangium sp. So ce296 TaxID=3133296 RepID=UPI003F6386B9